MTIEQDTIAEALATAPGWAKIGLTMPQERLREDARREMARHVYSTLYKPASVDTAQLPLPL
ncbi:MULTISPECIES: DUF6771 family protein [Sphingomonas]|uniref:DUF6771 family protein n=1 Tax=Sphingomonas TaxID=13687 RepID=UPI000F7F3F9A|nr:DUF6771 family protein [Sphingomonas sp. ABOLF]RSV14651.1 hypothetical protein CA235_11265 [Sphingomonas sp. ABOLF]GLK19254.1 hypothetical protein GCM10017606_00800 [Microbacterium terregens]